MTLKNNRAPLLCYFKLCAWFHCHMRIQTGVRVQKRLIPQSHRPNRHETDLKPTKILKFGGEIGLQSVLIRFCRFGVGLCSGRQICRGEIFQTCLKDLPPPTNCRLSVGYMSVWCRFCRGAIGDVSVLIRPPMVDGLSVLDRLCIRHMSADLTPIQGRFKTESSPT